MSAESDLYAALSGYAALTSLVGTRIYPDVLPEECAYPAVVFARQATDPVPSISGIDFGAFVDFQVGAWAPTRAAADAAGAQVEAALRAVGDPPTGRNAAFDPETGLYASLIEVRRLATA